MRPKYEKRVLTPYEDEVSISRLIEIQSDEKNVASFFFCIFRSFVVLMLAISIAWIPVITKYSNAQLFVYVQVVSNFFQPPIAAVFVLAMLWHRLTEKVIFFTFF